MDKKPVKTDKERKLDTDIRRGKQAEHLMELEAFKLATSSVRQAIMDKWASSPIRDTEGQHELRLMLKLLDDLMGNLKLAIDNGKFACNELEIERTLAEKAKRAFTN